MIASSRALITASAGLSLGGGPISCKYHPLGGIELRARAHQKKASLLGLAAAVHSLSYRPASKPVFLERSRQQKEKKRCTRRRRLVVPMLRCTFVYCLVQRWCRSHCTSSQQSIHNATRAHSTAPTGGGCQQWDVAAACSCCCRRSFYGGR